MTGRFATVTSYGRSAGSARVRVFDWLDHLGIEAVSHTYTNSASNSLSALARDPLRVVRAERVLRRLEADLGGNTLLLARQASPLSNGGIESRLLRAASRGVYDFDDALFLMDSPALFAKSRIWRRSVEAADVVIAGNDVLAEAAAAVNAEVVIVPSCVQPHDYTIKAEYEITDVPRAVWIGSPSTEKYLNDIAPALIQVNRSRGLRLSLISSGNQSHGPLDAITDRMDWSPTTMGRALAQGDMGIMPLADDPWSRGKCAYKLLQYAATGLPLIASPVGANVGVIDSSAGLAAQTLDDWIQALETIVDESAASRAARGRAGRATVVDSFSFAAWEDRWKAAVGLS